MNIHTLPDGPHVVYAIRDVKARVIYVGCTRNLEQRLQQHQADAWWWAQFADVEILHSTPNRSEGLRLEKQAIGELRPRWNRFGRTVRHAWTGDDYMDQILGYLVGGKFGWQLRSIEPMHLRWIAEANSRFGLGLSTDPERLLAQVARGEQVVSFGRVRHTPERSEDAA